jgi:CRISPR system Cascade subunit CasB
MVTKNYLSFDNPEVRTTLFTWWEGLDANRGERAELRRCNSITKVAFSPAYHQLRHSLMQFGAVNADRLAVVAAVLSHVKEDVKGNDPKPTVAWQMAMPVVGGERARVSGLRFRRLLKIDDPEELMSAMIRTVRLLGGTINVNNLAQSLYWWNERTKKAWAFDYYEHAPSEEK